MKTIEPLLDHVKKAGDKAAEKQARVLRDYKKDGSIITHIDRELNESLAGAVRNYFPDANIITEESDEDFDSSRKYSFVIDPVDGTDAYSQMIPGWCVAVGLLEDNQPAAGIIYAPLWGPPGGTFVYCDLQSPVYLNGREVIHEPDRLNPDDLQIMSSSKVHRYFDLRNFNGKIRTPGASIINIISPLIHKAVGAAVLVPCSIWDIAAAHAVVKRAGLYFSYLSGMPVDYTELYVRNTCRDFIITGDTDTCREITSMLIPYK